MILGSTNLYAEVSSGKVLKQEVRTESAIGVCVNVNVVVVVVFSTQRTMSEHQAFQYVSANTDK